MTSLGFEMLDRHVVHGRGREIACVDGPVTFEKLTERVAELAGGLRMLGVQAGSRVSIDLPPGDVAVTVTCAVIRLGAVPIVMGPIVMGPVESGALVRVRNLEGIPRVQTSEHDVELAAIQRAGRAEPAPSLHDDAPGYEEAVREAVGPEAFGDIVRTLLAGLSVV